MALVGTLLFCKDCGSILDRCPPDQLLVKCSMCFLENDNHWPVSQETTSKPSTFPSRLVDKRSNVQILTAEDRDTWTMTSKHCPKCEHDGLKFRDVQTRGADEGSTVFYKCPACGHGFKEDN
ncbi:hypothetical protein E4T39_00547 [Aureobasidium subglaciale]|nr:hypothetical protein E4T39_00547 [Aureobasidium subglaciale]